MPPDARACPLCGYRGGQPIDDAEVPAALDQAAREELAAQFDIGAITECDAASITYLAEDLSAHRRILLRVFDLPLLRRAGLATAIQSAMANAGALNHPHIVPLYRTGATARLLWCAMHAPDGRSLAATLAYAGPLDLSTCLGLVEQMASALHYAHRRGVVHGDLSPANIVMSESGWALLTDFSTDRIVRVLPGAARRPSAYIPPEESIAPRLTPAADQYALAVTVCECLTGPWPADVAAASTTPVREQLSHRVAEARRDLPASVRAALRRALSANPADRFQSVLAFAAALDTSEPSAVPAAPAPTAMPQEEDQRVVFVSEGQPARRAMRLVTRVALLMGVSGLGMARLFSADPALPRLAPAVVFAPWPGSEPAAAESPLTSISSAGAIADSVSAIPDLTPPDSGVGLASGDTVSPPVPDAPRPEERASQETGTAREVRAGRDPPATERGGPARSNAPRMEISLAPGRLYVSSRPWGQLFIDGQPVGNTPASGIPVPAGRHQIRITRDGFIPWESEVVIEGGRDRRLVDIQLRRVPP